MAVSPKNRLSEPTVPACVVGAKSGNCQHSRTEEPLEVAIVVRLSEGVVILDSCADDGWYRLSRVEMKNKNRIVGRYIVIGISICCKLSQRTSERSMFKLVKSSRSSISEANESVRHGNKPRSGTSLAKDGI